MHHASTLNLNGAPVFYDHGDHHPQQGTLLRVGQIMVSFVDPS